MMLSTYSAVFYSFAMGIVILACRMLPFLIFGREKELTASKKRDSFLKFIEKIVPPAAMTVLAFNSLAGHIKENPQGSAPALIAAAVLSILHIWRRNALLSIAGGTALYMALTRLM